MKKITTQQHYKITFPDSSTYYGRTTLRGNRRYTKHKSQVKHGTHDNKLIQEIYNKYGCGGWIHEWLGTETGDLEHHRKIEFGYINADPKSLNVHNGSFILNYDEYKRQRSQAERDNRTPEEHEEYKRRHRGYWHKHKAKYETQQKT